MLHVVLPCVKSADLLNFTLSAVFYGTALNKTAHNCSFAQQLAARSLGHAAAAVYRRSVASPAGGH